jgi:predicted nuclease of predicted toxin-antitoxin system
VKLKTDENIPLEAVNLLREAGHDVATVFDQSLGGRPDPEIASVCQREGRVLMTLDTDFSDIRTYSPSAYPGLIVLRLAKQGTPEVLHVVRCLLELLREQDCHRELWIVEPQRIRIRS